MPNPLFNAQNRVMGGGNPLADAGSVLRDSMSGFGKVSQMLKTDPSGVATTSMSKKSRGDLKNSVLMPKGLAEMFTRSKGSSEVTDTSAALTPAQTFGTGVVSEGLQILGAMDTMRAQEQQAIEEMQQQFGLQLDQIEFQEWMGDAVRQVSNIKSIMRNVKNIKRQGMTGGVQRQMFLQNPETGAMI